MKELSKLDILLNQFPVEIADSLIEFVKYISELEDDIIVFMARKSYCLYQVLLDVAFVPTQKIIASDRIFDLELPFLKDKRIALIDDTLIIGTTLSKTKQELETRYNAKVSVHVFCVDRENWNKNLIIPDKIFLSMEHQELLSFCTSIIKAFYVSARPYITDFPVLKKKRIEVDKLDNIITSLNYRCCDYSNELQEENNIRYFTLIPLKLRKFFNDNIIGIIDIFKLRLFSKQSGDCIYLTVIPIITIKSLSFDNLNKLFLCFLSDVESHTSIPVENIKKLFVKEEAKLKIIQYLLSCKLLSEFIKDASKMIDDEIKLIFDRSETLAHFGIWNFDLINDLELNSIKLFQSGNGYEHINHAALTEDVLNLANEFFNEINNELNLDSDLSSKFAEIFTMFFNNREKPFREKIRGLNADQIASAPEIRRLKDRLEKGLPFEIIINNLMIESINYKDMVDIGSIILDVCNDLGIAVPITCKDNGVIFRAYRHGEGVNITNSELSLIYHLVKSYLDSSGKDYITALVLQKLLVLFLKYGYKEHFIQPIRGSYNSNEGIKVKIDYDLKGAVSKYEYVDKTGTEKLCWFTDYLWHKKNILKKNSEGMFTINSDVEASHMDPSAPDRADIYGGLFGHLVYERKSDGDRPISVDDMIILSTCDSYLNTLKAIHVEIRIIMNWINERPLKKINWEDKDSLRGFCGSILHGAAYEAFNSAKFKYEGFIGNRNRETIESAAQYLANSETPFARMAVSNWNTFWGHLFNIDNNDEEKFEENIIEYIKLIIHCNICIHMILFCIKNVLTNGKKIKSDIKYFEKKTTEFIDPINKKSKQNLFNNAKILERLKTYEENSIKFPAEKTFNHYRDKLLDILDEMNKQYITSKELLENYGHIQKRHDYDYMIWYDVIDSTATHVPHDKTREHRRNVLSFKETINDILEQTRIGAKKKNVDMFEKQGPGSKDDEKHIFLSGNLSTSYLQKILIDLLKTSRSFNINLRVAIVPTDFVLSAVYREISTNVLFGTTFFEHYKRLETELRKIQDANFTGGNFLAIVNRETIKIEIPKNIIFEPSEKQIKIEIEQTPSYIKTQYGFVLLDNPNHSAYPLP
ncbi:MAG: phosphoribosyltransferase [Treponema sp.]|jgi:hypothetical protein|nr:phosphoribosyltransferase [Treponema sp.]